MVLQASSVIEVVDDSKEQADAERCSTSRTREEDAMVVFFIRLRF